jgi:hypothetical protein
MEMFALLLEENLPLWQKMLSGIPHSPAAILLYAMLLGSVILMWWGHKKS